MSRLAPVALASSIALSSLAAFAQVPPPPERAPMAPMRERAATFAGPAREFAGAWRSSADPSGMVVVRPIGPATVGILARPRFEAQGFVDDRNGCVALVRTPMWSADAQGDVRIEILRLRVIDAQTLRASFSGDLLSAPTRTETWERLEATPPPSTTDTTGRSALPKIGEYVSVDELPDAVSCVAPLYPDDARRKQIEGTVTVQALVGKDGSVLDARIAQSIPGLDAAAVDCVKRWRFKPALSQGQPVAIWVAVPIKFSLH